MNATLGSINPTVSTLINGLANSLFTASTPGTATINATVDSQTVTTIIDISPTNITVDNVTGYAGHQNETLTANVTAINGNTVNEGLVDFTVNGIDAGTAPITDDAATLDWTIPIKLERWNLHYPR